MKFVNLLPANKRLKQVIREHGNPWQVLAGPEPMQCFDNRPALRVISLLAPHHTRNVEVIHTEPSTGDKS